MEKIVIAPQYRELLGLELIQPPSAFPSAPELMITFDCGSFDRLGNLEVSARNAAQLIVIDHHLSNNRYGTINVIDAATDSPAWTLDMDLGLRPMTFTWNPDGSTKWILAQLTGFNGFAVVDFATRKEIRRIQNPDLPPGKSTVPEGSDPSHGMAVTPDMKTLVVCSRLNNYLYSYSLPDLKLTGGAELGGKGAGWVTLTPDGKSAYVANPVTNDVSVVDVASMKEVARIPVGFVPKRNTTGLLQ